jgi:hypothetical protein
MQRSLILEGESLRHFIGLRTQHTNRVLVAFNLILDGEAERDEASHRHQRHFEHGQTRLKTSVSTRLGHGQRHIDRLLRNCFLENNSIEGIIVCFPGNKGGEERNYLSIRLAHVDLTLVEADAI